MLTRRPTDLGNGSLADDYEIRDDEGRTVGRVYKAVNVTQDPWCWFMNADAPKTAKGVAPTLEKALEAFKAAWEPRRDR